MPNFADSRNIDKTVAQFAADPKRELFETLGKN